MNICTLLLLFPLLAPAAELPAGFAPERWPGRMPAELATEIQPLVRRLQEAQRRRDLPAMQEIVRQAAARMGRFAGVPETLPQYGRPVHFDEPDAAKAAELCRRSLESLRGRHGWEYGKGPGQPRLRVSFRSAMNYLRLYEAGVPGAEEYLALGKRGFDYIAGEQCSTGVFGYPYNPDATSGLVATALRLVREGERQGRKMTEGRWVIDDLDDGGLQFDNGEAGAGLLYAWALTRDAKYLAAARRAADWAASRPLVLNWNYNSFSGRLLARLYRVTGEQKYLDGAIGKFEYGVLPAQLSHGRWFDQHNASPQYHALLCRNLVEYSLALEQARHSLAKAAREKTLLALDSMAEEIATYGSPNGYEGLPLEALAAGLLAFGEHENWSKAANAYANFLIGGHLEERIRAKEPRPETLSAYLLYGRLKSRGGKACEVELTHCALAPPAGAQAQAADAAGHLRSKLAAAMAARDEAKVAEVVRELRQRLGPHAGAAEAEPRYRQPARFTPAPSREAVSKFWDGVFQRMEADYNGQGQWHLPKKDAPPTSVPLRYTSDPLQAMLAALEGGAAPVDRLQMRSREGAEFLLSVQQPSGLFPFPDIRPFNDFFGRLVETALRQHPEFLVKGWIVDDADGGLQFDNGVAGVALLEASRALREPRYLDAARRAGDWALTRPCVPNFNYNSFSSWLLARLYSETQEKKYLDGAVEKARIGVLPGLMESGRWVDPHNARTPYHWIMIRALATLEQALPASHPYRGTVSDKLELALGNVVAEVRTSGVASLDGLGILSDVCRIRAAKPEWLDALSIMANLAVESPPGIELAYSAGRYVRYRAEKQ